jgi:hypothetical protein
MPSIAPIFTKFTLAQHLFVKNSQSEFLENLTDGLVADTRSWSDVVSALGVTFYFVKSA